jgi:alpha-ketoglutarate-dependent 2,4-dichlorophenoxyacetate dioxygenase
MVNLGNRLWHTDSSFRIPLGGFSLLNAHIVPQPGPLGAGETEFADTCAAYDSLTPERQAKLERLQGEHSLMHLRTVLGFTEFAPEERAALPPAVQPLLGHTEGHRTAATHPAVLRSSTTLTGGQNDAYRSQKTVKVDGYLPQTSVFA